MQLEVTRDVVTDIWPLYRAGEASADSRALVDAYLSGDPAFGDMLEESETMPGPLPPIQLSPDAERRLLDDARSRARLRLLIIGGTIALAACMLMAAFGWLVLFMLRAG